MMRYASLRLILLFTLAASASRALGDENLIDAQATVRYLLSCQKPNGAFGPVDQEYTDMAWTYPAVHALRLLGADVPREEDCLRNGRGDTWRYPYWDFYNHVQLHMLLGAAERMPAYRSVTLFKQPIGRRHWEPEYTISDTKISYHHVASLWRVVTAIRARGGQIANRQETARLLAEQFRPDGSHSGHIIPTCQAVLTLAALGSPPANAEKCVAWIQSCQLDEGGFCYSPTDDSPSNLSDILYTRLAVKALAALDARPANLPSCQTWINRLHNADGGFGDRPGWNSRLASTFWAVDSLHVLAGDARQGIISQDAQPQSKSVPENKYLILQAHHKSPPGGAEMVEAVRRIGLDLVAVKAPPEAVQTARDYVREKGYALEVVACPENYSHRLALLGVPEGNHISNFIVPPDMNPDQQAAYEAVMAAGKKGLAWSAFKRQVIEPMQTIGTLFYPEHEYDITNAYMVYDDAVFGHLGYNAIHASHFGGKRPDWIRLYPFRERWLGKLPFLADGDAHGDIEKWLPELNRSRTLYLAQQRGLAGYLDACRDCRTVCVIRDSSVPSGLVFYGAKHVVEFMKKHRDQWQWW